MSKNVNTMVPAKYPFTGYLMSEFVDKKSGRYYIGLYPEDKKSGLKPTTRSKARYMMSVHLGRVLEKWEQVDHKNGDHTDDRVDNFQILTVGDNNRKCRIEQDTKAIPVDLVCPICSKDFQMAARNYRFHTKRGRIRFSCSRKCGYKLGKRTLNKK
jgi:hypothetical protein